MNRLLSIDGGGVRGFFSLEVLLQIEKSIRENYQDDSLVLADYFNFIGGTSVGAIIAACLCRGDSVEGIQRKFDNHAEDMFKRSFIWDSLFINSFQKRSLERFLRNEFSDSSGNEILLGNSEELRTLLLLVLRNATSGGVWPITNNPSAKFAAKPESSNLCYPLWQLIRASTAAPTYFPPETIKIPEGREHEFIDGGVSPFNNPSFLMYLLATLPEYRMGMATGVDDMLLVSVGSGYINKKPPYGALTNMHKIGNVLHIIHRLMSADAWYQDLLCRTFGCYSNNPTAEEVKFEKAFSVDNELGTMLRPDREGQNFTYLRYDHQFTNEEEERYSEVARSSIFGASDPFALDRLESIDLLKEIGVDFAKRFVKSEHFPIEGELRLNQRIINSKSEIASLETDEEVKLVPTEVSKKSVALKLLFFLIPAFLVGALVTGINLFESIPVMGVLNPYSELISLKDFSLVDTLFFVAFHLFLLFGGLLFCKTNRALSTYFLGTIPLLGLISYLAVTRDILFSVFLTVIVFGSVLASILNLLIPRRRFGAALAFVATGCVLISMSIQNITHLLSLHNWNSFVVLCYSFTSLMFSTSFWISLIGRPNHG